MDTLKSRLRAILYPPGTNPLNWKICFIVFCSVVSETFNFGQNDHQLATLATATLNLVYGKSYFGYCEEISLGFKSMV